jgi:hypothetical protein
VLPAASQAEQPAVEQLAGGRPARHGEPTGSQGGVEAAEAEQDHGPSRRQRHGAQRRLGEQRERPLGADQQPGEVEVVLRQHVVQEVAAAVEGGARPAGADQRRVLLEQADDREDDVLQPAGRAVRRRPAWLPGHRRRLPGVEHGAEGGDVVARVAVAQGGGPGGVVGQHAADGTPVAAGRVGGEAAADAGQLGVQVAVDHPRLDADPVGADLEDVAEVPAQVDDEAGAEGLAGDAGAGPARHERHLVLGGVADDGLDVLLVPRDDHAERPDLEDAGVGAVERAAQVVEQDVAADNAAQVVADALAVRLVEWGHVRKYPRLAAVRRTALATRGSANCR